MKHVVNCILFMLALVLLSVEAEGVADIIMVGTVGIVILIIFVLNTHESTHTW